jgi:hypothetical protein
MIQSQRGGIVTYSSTLYVEDLSNDVVHPFPERKEFL